VAYGRAVAEYPQKPAPGDKVAIVSASGGLPEVFPAPYELGLRRLRESFELVPVEYPTTRRLGSTPTERAADLQAAFGDPEIRAVIATIGGEDQITVLKHLDADLLRANPKPFFGYSDNTNLLNYLHNLGIVGYHGGSVMVQFGRGGAMHPDSEASLRAALFTKGEFDLTPATGWTDIGRDWAEPGSLDGEPPLKPGTGWQWYGPDRIVEGALWGGCLEIVDWQRGGEREVRRGPVRRRAACRRRVPPGPRPGDGSRHRPHRPATHPPVRRSGARRPRSPANHGHLLIVVRRYRPRRNQVITAAAANSTGSDTAVSNRWVRYDSGATSTVSARKSATCVRPAASAGASCSSR
jgi:hypothetical protein